MLKKLGRLYAEFLKSVRKTGDLKIQQDLQAAKNVEDGLNSQAFVDYINKNFPAKTDAEKKEAIETLDKIYRTDEPLFAEQRKEFMSGYNEIIPAEEPTNETTKIASSSGANLGAGVVVEESRNIDQEVAETSRRRSAGQTPSVLEQQAEASNLDTSTYEKYEKLGLIGNEQATIAYLAANPDLPLEEIEFLNAAASDAPLRPVERDGKTFLVPFPGHFTSVPLADIIDNFASSQEILNYQTFLMENNIVPQNYFASSMGEYSEELRTSIKVVMNWIDKNLYAEEGTDLYNEVNKGMESSPIYFQKTQELNGSFSYHRQLFNYGLQQMAKNAEQFDAAQEAEVARKMAQEYIPPADYVLDDMVEGAFEAKLGRKPTAEELDKWSTRFAASYSIAYNQNRAQAEKLQSFNFLTAQPELAGLTFEEAAELQEQYPGKGMVDLSVFSTVSPEEVRAKQFEDEFGNVIEARQTGAEVRKMQQDMLTYMFGS